MRELTLGKKIALGFGLLITLALGLGGVVSWQMLSVEKSIVTLDRELVPEAAMGSELERAALQTMFEMRGYALSEEKPYLEEARKNLEQVKQALASARKLPHWNEDKLLQEKIAKAEAQVGQYEKLVGETVARNEAIAKNRQEMAMAAESFMKEANDYLEEQSKTINEQFELGSSASQLQERLRKIALINEVVDLGNRTRIAANMAQAQRNPKLIAEGMPNFDKINAKLDELKAGTKLAVNLKQIQEAREASGHYKQAISDLVTNWQALQELNKTRNAAAYQILDQARATSGTAMKEADDLAEHAAVALSRASLLVLLGLAVAAALGCLMAFSLTRGITRPIRLVIEGLSEGAAQVSSAAGQVATASQQLAVGSSQQAASLEETSSSLEEMASMTKTNADNASQADHIMKEAQGVVTRANAAMEELSRAMERITVTSDHTAKIVKTIDEIAFQTNLLALNAAVEAARGRGRSGVRRGGRGGAQSGHARRRGGQGHLGAHRGEHQEHKIGLGPGAHHRPGLRRGGRKLRQGRRAGGRDRRRQLRSEQAQGIEQVTKAAVEMDKVTQQNAANAEESASASEELSAQAQTMQCFVEDMARMVGGTAHAANPAKLRGRIAGPAPALPAPEL